MVEVTMIIVGALMFVGAGIVVVSPDSDIYVQGRWFCGCVALIGLGLMAKGVFHG